MNLASLLSPKFALPIGLLVAMPVLILPTACSSGGDNTATGGTGAGAAGGAGGSAGAGAGGMAMSGSAGMAMSGSSGTGNTMALPDPGGCGASTIITKSCSIAGCHRPGVVVAGNLDLTINEGFRSRVVGVASKHVQIDCNPDPVAYMECVPPPATCPTGDMIVNTTTPADSWILKKLDGGQMCGDGMPLPPGDSASMGWGPAAKTCLQNFFMALAMGQ